MPHIGEEFLSHIRILQTTMSSKHQSNLACYNSRQPTECLISIFYFLVELEWAEKRLPIWRFKYYSNQFQIYLSQIFKFFTRQSFLQKGLLWVGFDLGSPGWQPSILTTIPTQHVRKLGSKSKLYGLSEKSGKYENWLQSNVETFEPTNIFFA